MQTEPSLGGAELTRLTANRDMYKMMIKQQPRDGQVLTAQKRASAKKPQNERLSLDPPAVVELAVLDDDPSRCWLHSPYLFCTAELVRLDDKSNRSDTLSGTLTSSLHVVKMNDGKAHGFFVFSDLVPLCAGMFFLRFTLFEMRKRYEGQTPKFVGAADSAKAQMGYSRKCSTLSPA
ncbi:uncharacterized protein Z519_08869 [Cladophialophora bantiana CBS 173.52]|uniref:Velvet domain-containing protein n=1 Tax=Cladophialophora bantiana (strain ATCC 10958 / CBS 173.52 / CDC B-1940 / NIH 8579) TaxID=1442370 RepID=A0A0D2HHF8_CLAB1|nr:uncharacterized protein Z519_08869 [Cladophialophora bantiana CBS 173.52]KIW90225.1 hypothetical protein Z519_08869 [Cladophialophora bantiana CBS 173.52]